MLIWIPRGEAEEKNVVEFLTRQKPWVIEGIGHTEFPITTANPEVQQWFNQGITLLHCFWYIEAERAFRWCMKLDPNCAMAYWGLARAVREDERDGAAEIIREAVKRKASGSARERRYIEAWDGYLHAKSSDSAMKKLVADLDELSRAYPDDTEAKCLLAWFYFQRDETTQSEKLLREIVAHQPDHLGAQHYLVHSCDMLDHAEAVLTNCQTLAKLAPASSHIQHMPGHIYTKLGMWHEAAIAMDTAARVEARYLREAKLMPFEDWNYAHNRHYFSYVLEQLGMADAAIAGAREMLNAPLDPRWNTSSRYSISSDGVTALVRALVKFERWDEILVHPVIPWRGTLNDRMWKSYCETVANLGLNNLDFARRAQQSHEKLQSEINRAKDDWLSKVYSIQSLELRARMELREGKSKSANAHLSEAAAKELAFRQEENDPPIYPVSLYNLLGRAYLAQKNPKEAISAFEKTLTVIRNDAFALAGLTEAYLAFGDMNKAREMLSQLLFVWSDADAEVLKRVTTSFAKLDAQPHDTAPVSQRRYKSVHLESIGPLEWIPNDAPQLDVSDSKGHHVTLADFKGKTILLIFAPNFDSKPQRKQLEELRKHRAQFSEQQTELLLINSKAPTPGGKNNSDYLLDPQMENAKRFSAYDDFEEAPLKAMILIDAGGKVRWSHFGKESFTNFDFLLSEVRRIRTLPPSF